MNTNINLIEEELEEDLVHTVIDSLRNHHTDYCFSNKDFKSILSLAKEAGIGLIYKVFYDRYDKLDYVEFIPANFYVSALPAPQHAPLHQSRRQKVPLRQSPYGSHPEYNAD